MGQFLPTRLTRQPQQSVQIDWANPLTRGLRDVRTPADRSDLVAVNSPVIATGSPGIGFDGNGSSSYWRSVGTKSVNAGAEHTIFALVQGTAAADSRIYTLADGSTTIIQIGAGNVDATKLRLWERSPGADVGAVSTTATVFEAVRPHAAVLRYRTGILESFVDGVADVTSAGTTTGPAALAQVGIGALVRASAPAAYSAAALFLGLFWDRALSDAEIASISANPWQLFKNPQRRLLVDVPAAGPVNATGTLASTLGDATIAASGAVLNAGAFASSLGNATMAASGAVGSAPSGVFASALAGATMSAAGAATNAGSFATSLAGASMSASGIVINRGAFSATMGDATMAAVGTVAPNATGTFSSTLDGATMTAYGYNGVPPVLAGFFHRLPKNPRHVQRIP